MVAPGRWFFQGPSGEPRRGSTPYRIGSSVFPAATERASAATSAPVSMSAPPYPTSIGSSASASAPQVERSRERQWAVSGQSDENSAVAAMDGGTAARSCAV